MYKITILSYSEFKKEDIKREYGKLFMVFCLKNLPTPHNHVNLKKCNGNDREFRKYFFANGVVRRRIETIYDHIVEELDQYQSSSNVTIGFYCKHGKHRSVAVSSKIYELLSKEHEVELVQYI